MTPEARARVTGTDAAYPELEIGLHRAQADAYQVELRFLDPASDAETAPRRSPCPLNPEALLPLQLDPLAYGQALSAQVFADPDALTYLRGVKTSIEATDRVLRLRLLVGPTAAELHTLRWELLCDPDSGLSLASSERVLFSRFMLSQDWRPVRLRPKAALRALVAVAAPTDLAEYGRAPVDLAGEIARARESLAGISVTVLGQEQPLTIAALDQALRAGTDILYLVAHGRLDRIRGPVLLLQRTDGRTQEVLGGDLAQRVGELREPPRLAVLASCESAATLDAPVGTENEGATDQANPQTTSLQAALAPRLAAAGVPAVLAMQGRFSMETAATALPCFFQELMKDGQLDRALAVARGFVRDRPDAWVPALYLRLRSGRLWYEPGFGGNGSSTVAAAGSEAVKWTSLINDILKSRFTPIVGWGLAEGFYGSAPDLAQRLAASSRFPLAPHQSTDLPQVSQYLRVTHGSSSYPTDAVQERLRLELLARHQDLLAPEDRDAKLARLVKKIAALRRQDPDDPYRLVAALPARVFIDATPDGLLTEALKDAGKEPEERFLVWQRNQKPPSSYQCEPSVARPLVYQILGRFRNPKSLVLTQDDYFDYLIGASRDSARIPSVVLHALTGQTLIFLGFQLADWSFRVLFRLIMSQEGGAQGNNLKFPHAAVQVDPEGSQLINIAEARRYLTASYGSDQISLYWGRGEDFLRDLAPRLPVRTPAEWDKENGCDDDY